MSKELKAIFNHFGQDHQLLKMQEECYECIEAINNYMNSTGTFEHVLEEMADVKVVASQFDILYPQMHKMGMSKIKRTLKRYDIKIKRAILADWKKNRSCN